MKYKEFGIRHWYETLRRALRRNFEVPSIKLIVLILLFPFMECVLYSRTGSGLNVEQIMYLMIITLTPFILGKKFQETKLVSMDTFIIILLIIYIFTIGLDYKEGYFYTPVRIIISIITLVILLLWLLYNLAEVEAELENFFKKKKANKKEHLEKEPPLPADEMEVD